MHITTVVGFFGSWITFFFLLTPFFAITVFLTLTANKSPARRRKTAIKSTVAMMLIGIVLFLFGNTIFHGLGITVDSFRVGAGILLFLVALDSVRGRDVVATNSDEIAVVPLAVPIAVGPGTIGTILVIGSESVGFAQAAWGLISLLCAILTLGALFLGAHALERHIHKDVLAVLSKLTGLILAAFAAQLVLTGARNLLTL